TRLQQTASQEGKELCKLLDEQSLQLQDLRDELQLLRAGQAQQQQSTQHAQHASLREKVDTQCKEIRDKCRDYRLRSTYESAYRYLGWENLQNGQVKALTGADFKEQLQSALPKRGVAYYSAALLPTAPKRSLRVDLCLAEELQKVLEVDAKGEERKEL